MNKIKTTLTKIGKGISYTAKQIFKAGKHTRDFLRNQKEEFRKQELENLDHQNKVMMRKLLLSEQKDKLINLKYSYMKKTFPRTEVLDVNMKNFS